MFFSSSLFSLLSSLFLYALFFLNSYIIFFPDCLHYLSFRVHSFTTPFLSLYIINSLFFFLSFYTLNARFFFFFSSYFAICSSHTPPIIHASLIKVNNLYIPFPSSLYLVTPFASTITFSMHTLLIPYFNLLWFSSHSLLYPLPHPFLFSPPSQWCLFSSPSVLSILYSLLSFPSTCWCLFLSFYSSYTFVHLFSSSPLSATFPHLFFHPSHTLVLQSLASLTTATTTSLISKAFNFCLPPPVRA